MACGGNSTCFCLGVFFSVLALVLDVIGVASPYWIYAEDDGAKIYAGLWEMCASGKTQYFQITGCADLKDLPDWFKAVQALGIIGIIVFLIAVIFAFLKICLRERYSVLIISIALSFFGAVLMVVSVALYAEKIDGIVTPSSLFHFHFAFVFCVLSIVFSTCSGACMIIELLKRSQYTSIGER